MRQENLETIHQHNVVAERYGLVDELLREAEERRAAKHLELDLEDPDTARTSR